MTVNDDNNRFGKVAVLLGGTSGERAVSLRSGKAIVAALKQRTVDAHPVDSADGVIEQLTKGNFDRVFIALHGKGGEDGVIQGTLETMALPYTGSGVLGSAIAMDKLRSKQIWQVMGLPVINGESLKAEQRLSTTEATAILDRLGMSVMVKPAAEGSSLGVTKAQTVEQLLAAIYKAAQYGGEVLIEQWIDGSEYAVSLLNEQTLPAVRIQPQREFYDYQAKYSATGTEYFCPSGLTATAENELAAIAQKAFTALHCDGWGRVDFIRDNTTGKFYLLELNTVPGMTETSLLPMAAKAMGLDFSQLVIEILTTSEAKEEKVMEAADG